MASDWREFTFSELINTGALEIGDGYRAKISELGGDGPIFLRAGHVTDTHIDFAGVDRFGPDSVSAVASKMSRPGDVIVTTKGNSTGRVAFVDPSMPSFVYSPHLSYWRSLNQDKIVPGFLRYWSRSREFRTQLSGLSASTDMAPYLSLVDQRRLRINLPSSLEQRAISDALSALDDKIELNRRMNETLEATARAIFTSWFMDFDPVRAKSDGGQPFGMNAATAALFPNSFQDSPLGKIPKGWRAEPFGEIAENPRRGVDPGAAPADAPYIGLEHMPRKSIALTDWGRSEEVASNKFAFRHGEILFGKLRPYFHKVGIAPVDGVCSTDILVIRAKAAEWHGLVLGHASSEEFVSYTDAVSTGTKMPRTSWHDMAQYKIALPDSSLAEVFSSFSRGVAEMIRQNILQSKSLAAMRDSLLPKLLSGALRLKQFGAHAEKALL